MTTDEQNALLIPPAMILPLFECLAETCREIGSALKNWLVN